MVVENARVVWCCFFDKRLHRFEWSVS